MSLARGQALGSDIGQVPPFKHEMAVAVQIHYAIGVALALVYLFLSSALSGAYIIQLQVLRMLSARTHSRGYSCFRQWAMDGWAGGPPGTWLFFSSLVSHSFYGVGLWFAHFCAGVVSSGYPDGSGHALSRAVPFLSRTPPEAPFGGQLHGLVHQSIFGTGMVARECRRRAERIKLLDQELDRISLYNDSDVLGKAS